ncbi:hypothetical protein [Ralstonia sp. ASV6]|uniref:hypothetical protein n=1 Tax=Ralstonia sp. ASV6 TaxID=2795124 RepID=UPI0018EDF90A|nr:hypothetical protein [Ralstonia sp. ASV6]
MPCYTETIKPPSQEEYETWKRVGYIGSWEEYCAAKEGSVGQRMFLCGDFGPHCADCAAVGSFLCDYPVGDGKTCDRSMCGEHAHEIGPELHYCAPHYKMWQDFKDKGGVDEALRNVIAFKHEKS